VFRFIVKREQQIVALCTPLTKVDPDSDTKDKPFLIILKFYYFINLFVTIFN
jgi:hypothetical protein